MKFNKAPIGTPMIADPKAGAVSPVWMRWLDALSTLVYKASTPAPCWDVVGTVRVTVTGAVFVVIGCMCLIQVKTTDALTITLPRQPMMDTPYFDGVIWRTIPAGSTTVTFPATCTAQVQYIFQDEAN